MKTCVRGDCSCCNQERGVLKNDRAYLVIFFFSKLPRRAIFYCSRVIHCLCPVRVHAVVVDVPLRTWVLPSLGLSA